MKEKQGKKMGKIIAKAWIDDEFKRKLLTDTAAVLKEEGVEVPEGIVVRAVENTDKLFHLVLPPKPDIKEMNDEQLQRLTRDGIDPGLCWCSLLVDWTGLVH
jgi:hypothetical protein